MSTTYHHHPFLNLSGVFAGSGRITNAPNSHLWALSLFFLVPLSFSLMFYPALQSQSDSLINHYTCWLQPLFIFSSDTSPHPTKTEFLLLPLLYSLFVLVLSLVVVSTITYSTFRVFDGSPVKFVSSIKSVLHSFLPLLCTFIFSLLIMSLIVLFFALLVALVYKGLMVLGGFHIDLQSNYFMFPLRIVVLVTLIWLQVNWSLWAVIVVVESKWGYESLRRSRYLVNGMKRVALSLMFYDFLIGYMVWGSSTSVANARQTNGWLNWTFVFSMLINSVCITTFTSRIVVANVVLYMYCKALHGELAIEIAREFSNEDMSLPFDYEKLSHVL